MQKLGQEVCNESNDKHIVLKNPEGQNYQVSHTAHLVWSMLDGSTELKEISQKISQIADLDVAKTEDIVDQIVDGLIEVELIKK